MSVLFLAGVFVTLWAEQNGNPVLTDLGVQQSGGNMEGKEVRFGIPASALFAVVTTDSGHKSSTAFDATFFADQEAAVNFLYQAVGKVAQVGKQVVIARNGFWKHGPLGYHLPQKGTKSGCG